MARFESEQPNVSYLHVNIDQRDTPENAKIFKKYFQGKSIPYTVLVDKDGHKISDWTGYVAYGKLIDDIKEAGAK